MEVTKLSLSIGVAILVVAHCLYKAVYNLYFHPLARIPGPWWAAVSYFPEMYYDMIKGGRYWTVVVQMHENYGVDDDVSDEDKAECNRSPSPHEPQRIAFQ
jgi:hypothetical protein